MEFFAIFIGMCFCFGMGYIWGYQKGEKDGYEVGEKMNELRRQQELLNEYIDPSNYIHLN